VRRNKKNKFGNLGYWEIRGIGVSECLIYVFKSIKLIMQQSGIHPEEKLFDNN
jgi:hypothetical protein